MQIKTETFLRLRIISEEKKLWFLLNKTWINPDESWDIWDKRNNGTIFNFSCIIKNSPLSEFDHIEKHTIMLLDILEPYYTKIKKLSRLKWVRVLFSYGIYFDYDDMPCTFFDKKYIEKISAMGASLDLDMYPNMPWEKTE